jgi:hypothetical protein
MQLSTEYRGRHFDLSTVDLECAEDVWGLPSGSWLGFHRKATVPVFDHPHHLFAVRLGRWTVVLEFTGANQAWHCPTNAALRAQRSRQQVEAMSRFFGQGIAPLRD